MKRLLLSIVLLVVRVGLVTGWAQPYEYLVGAQVRGDSVVAANSNVATAQEFTLAQSARIASVQVAIQVWGQINVVITDGLWLGAKVYAEQTIYGNFPETQMVISFSPAINLPKGTYYLVFLNDPSIDFHFGAGLATSNGSFQEDYGNIVGRLYMKLDGQDFMLCSYPAIVFEVSGKEKR